MGLNCSEDLPGSISLERVRETLPARLWLQLRQAPPEKLAAIECLLAGAPLPDAQQNSPSATPPASSQFLRPERALNAAIEGDPASGRFCIRFAPANESIQSPSPQSAEPDQETLTIAAKVFELLGALDPGKRLRKAPPITVFLLRFRRNFSLSQIARACECGKSLVAVRLKAIRKNLPWQPQQLRELSAHVEAVHEAMSDSRARRIYRKAALYGDGEEEGQEG